MKSLFLLLLLSFFCGCQKSHKHETRLLLDWMPNPNHAPLYVGLKNGFFTEQNIQLNIQKPCEAGGGLPYLMENKTDILLSYLPETIYNSSKGAKIKIVGTLFKQPLNAFIFLKEANIQSKDDLNQKKLGYCVDNTTDILNQMLASNCINFSEKHPVQFDLLTTLIQKKVDVIYGAYWNIEPSQLEVMGFKTGYLPFTDFDLPNYYELVFLMRDGENIFLDDFAKRFQTALQKSIDYCKTYPQESLEDYLSFHPDFTSKTKKWSAIAWEKTFPIFACNQNIENDVLEKYYLWLVENNIIHTFDFQNLFIKNSLK